MGLIYPMAESNYRGYLKGDMVKAKKYLYVLRPILACRWIIDRGTLPPMLFDELVTAELPEHLKADVDRFLDIKMHSPEIEEIPKIEALNDYSETSIAEINGVLTEFPEMHNSGWEKLNDLFLQTLNSDMQRRGCKKSPV